MAGWVSMETVCFKFPHWGTECVGGDEGNEKAKKRQGFFLSVVTKLLKEP